MIIVFIDTDICLSYSHSHTVQSVKSRILFTSLSSTYQDFNTMQTYTIYTLLKLQYLVKLYYLNMYYVVVIPIRKNSFNGVS